MMGNSINFFLLTLVSEKHRKFVKVMYYVAAILFYILLLTNVLRIFPLPETVKNVVFLISLIATAVSFLTYKLSYLIFRKIQNTGGDEVLVKYNSCFDKHIKKSNIALIISIVCFVLMFVSAIVGMSFEDRNNAISIACIILVGPFLIGFMACILISLFSAFSFGKKEEHKEVIALRKEQVLKMSNENFKAIASGAVNYSRLEDYLYPVPSYKKKYKRNSNIFGAVFIFTMFAIIVPILTVILKSENENIIFKVLVISFSVLLILVLFEALLLSYFNTKLIKRSNEYMKTCFDRYSANIKYVDLVLGNVKKQRKFSFIFIGGLALSFIFGITAGILGLDNIAAEGMVIAAISIFFVSCVSSIILSLLVTNKNKSALLACQIEIEQQEKEFAEKQKAIDEATTSL